MKVFFDPRPRKLLLNMNICFKVGFNIYMDLTNLQKTGGFKYSKEFSAKESNHIF